MLWLTRVYGSPTCWNLNALRFSNTMQKEKREANCGRENTLACVRDSIVSSHSTFKFLPQIFVFSLSLFLNDPSIAFCKIGKIKHKMIGAELLQNFKKVASFTGPFANNMIERKLLKQQNWVTMEFPSAEMGRAFSTCVGISKLHRCNTFLAVAMVDRKDFLSSRNLLGKNYRFLNLMLLECI